MTSWRVLIVGSSALVASSCAPPTAITVDVFTEVDCAENAEVSLTIAPDLLSLASRAPSSTTRGCIEPGRAGNVVIAPADDREKPLAFAIATRVDEGSIEECLTSPLPSGCIVARRQLRFSPNQELPMRVDLRIACQGIECPAEQTCVKGACVPAEVEPERCVGGCDEATLPAPACPLGEIHLLQEFTRYFTTRIIRTSGGLIAAWRILQSDQSATLHVQPLAEGGAPSGPPWPPISSAQGSTGFLLGYDGAGVAVVYDDAGAMILQKLDLEGNVLEGPTSITTMYGLHSQVMAWSGTRFGLSGSVDLDEYFFTMDASGALGPPEFIDIAQGNIGVPAWNGTSFALPWWDIAAGGCHVSFFSAEGTPSGMAKRVGAESCVRPHLSPHPEGWNYVYEVDDRIEYVLLDAQGDPITAPVTISPPDGKVYGTPRSIPLESGKTWVTFREGLGALGDFYATLLVRGDVVLQAARYLGAAAVSRHEVAVQGDRVNLVYEGHPPAGGPEGVYSTVLCGGSAP
ncbi:hypothetical protein [Polyangium sorediatum]|uniref:Lipoprotein n=1 Tax=Polyangium sorediatum TaxID=889274 RepID=A0ABT6P350_9BACT|nr:hypothetical protein [Polyangium sorediatum]MDI1434988.1 hypothetical protein [Polyangium sorediatum]